MENLLLLLEMWMGWIFDDWHYSENWCPTLMNYGCNPLRVGYCQQKEKVNKNIHISAYANTSVAVAGPA